MNTLEKITPRSKDFAQWYTDLITASKLVGYSAIKGETIFRPNGWAIWTQIQEELDRRYRKHGILNVAFPTFIKFSDFMKEKEHVEGFAPEVFLVTKKGQETLSDPYVVRPTSEVLFCDYFKKIVTSYNDLPVKVNQWCNVFRAEKNTRPFLRTTEFFWHELHTIHSSKAEAVEQAKKMVDEYYDFVTKVLLIPCLQGEKTVGERFAGAENTYTIEALMQDGQALQCGTSHYLGQTFAKTYDIQFTNKDNKLEYVYQTSTGASTRLIGAIIMSHSDDHGLKLPFGIAPTQIAILGLFVHKEPKVTEVANKLAKTLSKYRVKVDLTDKSFGYKVAESEVTGVPFSIIVGPNDLKENKVTILRRDTLTKEVCDLDKVENKIEQLIPIFQNNLYQAAKKNLESKTIEVDNIDDFKKAIDKKKLVVAPWAGDEKDEKKIKQMFGATPRCIKQELKDDTKLVCFLTGKKAKYIVYFARAY